MRSMVFGSVICLVGLGLLCGCSTKRTTSTLTYVTPIQVQMETQGLPDATEGAAYSETLIASGGSGTFAWTIEAGGTNDGWLTIDNTGAVMGNPTSAEVGPVTLFIKVADNGNATNFDIAVFTFNVLASPNTVRITTSSVPDANVGYFYSEILDAEGGSGSFTWQKLAGGTNDGWMTVNAGGTLTGIPNSGNLGPVTLHIRVVDTNDATKVATATFNIQVYTSALAIDNASPLPSAALSASYSVTLRAAGGSGSYVWNIEPGGANDSWLSIGATTGDLTGTAPGTGGTTTVNVSVTDANNPVIFTQKTFNITIKSLAISVERLDDAFVGTPYSQALSCQGATGSPVYTIEPGGSNYIWLGIIGSTLQCAAGPTANELGPVNVLIKAVDGSNSDVRAFQFTVFDPIQIVLNLPDANVGMGYSQVVQTTGGTGNLTWSKETGGSNDSWLSIDATTGRLSGTPASGELGNTSVVVKAVETDYPTISDQKTITFTVRGVTITTSGLPDASVGQAYSLTINAIGGSGYYAWSPLGGPAWLTINPDTGVLSGTPLAGDVGMVNLTAQVRDPIDPTLTDTKNYSFWVVNSILREDFSGGLPSGWTATGDWQTGSRSQLYIGPQSAHSGSVCAGTRINGLYLNSRAWGSCDLTTGTLNFSGLTAPVLEFYQWYQTQSGQDGGNVKVDAGLGFNVVNTLTPAYGGTAGGQNAYTGFGVSRNGWRRVVVDLSAFQGMAAVQIQWSFFSNGGVQNPGWYIDSVHVFDLFPSPTPKPVINPVPPDGIVYAPPEIPDFTTGIPLTWDAALGAANYRVYLGTDYNSVLTATPGSLYDRGLVGTTRFNAITLTAGNTYFWRIDAVGAATTPGPVWCLTTANPVPVFVNEVGTMNWSNRDPYVELYNPSSSVSQDITGWDLRSTYSGGNLQSFTIPGRVILDPLAARCITSSDFYYHGNSPYRAWDCIAQPFNFGWNSANTEGEVWIRDPSGNGRDYIGWNITTSNRPGDLNWTGSLTWSSWTWAIWRRRTNTDTDSSADFRNDYYTYYGPSWGYLGTKDAGQ